MMLKSFFFSVLFTFSTLLLFAQKQEINSILSISPKKSFNIYSFNKSLKKELSTSILAVYNFKNLERVNFGINTSYFRKPISKYAYENFREWELYKNSLPKPIDFTNFKPNMNTCPR